MLHLALTALLVAPQAAASRAADPLAEYAERIEATDSLHERVDLARFARRSDPGGSLWWYEVEARARQRIADHAAAVRLLTEALANPLVDRDRAVLHELRARSLDFLNDRERSLADLARAAELDYLDAHLDTSVHIVGVGAETFVLVPAEELPEGAGRGADGAAAGN